MESQSKLSVLSENDTAWPDIMKETRTPSIEPAESDAPRPIFRRPADLESDDDMFVLKRANPVYDSDDDEEEIYSPAKRQRTGEPAVLSWCDRVDEDEIEGFAFSESSLLSH